MYHGINEPWHNPLISSILFDKDKSYSKENAMKTLDMWTTKTVQSGQVFDLNDVNTEIYQLSRANTLSFHVKCVIHILAQLNMQGLTKAIKKLIMIWLVQLVVSIIPACTCVHISILTSSAKHKPSVRVCTWTKHFKWLMAKLNINSCHLSRRHQKN